jgi:circadian clock protein KaiC
MQFLLEGARDGERSLCVTLSETKNELCAVAASHGWSLDAIAVFEMQGGDDDLRPQDEYTAFHPSEVELGETIQTLLEEIERVKPSRVIIDSLSEMRLLARDPLRYRRQILGLKHFFIKRNSSMIRSPK